MSNRIHVLVVEPDGSLRKTQVLADLGTLRDLIGGGYLEGVGSAFGSDWFAYVDEDGKRKALAPNRVATSLARRLGWADANDTLVGPAVFLGPADEEGDDTDVRPRVLVEAAKVAGLIPEHVDFAH